MSKPRKIRTPANGKPWPKAVVKRALELLEETRNATEARRRLADELVFEPHPPARSTLVAWAKRGSIALDVTPGKTRDTTAATEARLERLAQGRDALSELLLDKLSKPAAALLMRRLETAVDAEELVDVARERWADSMKLEAQVRQDFGPKSDELKSARRATYDARVDLELAKEGTLEVRDLVGILTRTLGDHLVIEGLDLEEEEDQGGNVEVTFNVPRPDPKAADAAVVRQADLTLIEGGAGG